MTNHAVIIGEMDMDHQRVNEIFMDAWHDQPDQTSETLSDLDEIISNNSAEVAFIRIDEVRNSGLKVTRLLKQRYPKLSLVWMAYGKNYALAAFDEGVDAYLELPLSSEKLMTIKERFLRNANSHS